ncbi:hypothetical protein HYY73_02685 [Candidatus Woesearchaeota archaeon]|nr:hypothetical protein [Candidatus Woesearchaeota archaeon]
MLDDNTVSDSGAATASTATIEDIVATAPTMQHRSIVQRSMRFLKEHKMVGYVAISGLFAPVATGASYLAGLHLPVDEISSQIGLQSSSLGTAAVTATTSTLTRITLDAIVPQQLLYFFNKDIYPTDKGGWKSFATHFTGFNLAARTVEGATGFMTTALMLSHGVPYGIAVLTNGTATSPANYAVKFFLYHLMVLKENPWPKIESGARELSHSAVERVTEAKHMATARTKALAYQLMTFINVCL